MKQKFYKRILLFAFVGMSILAQAQKNVRYHTVEEGQTLYAIARLYKVSPNEILKLNPSMGDLIRPGDKVRIPDVTTVQQVASGPGSAFVGTSNAVNAPVSTPVSTPVNDKVKTTHQIKKKDTLYRIALENHITIQELLDANPGMTENTKLRKGEWLNIPFSKAELQSEETRLAAQRAAEEAANKRTSKKHLNIAVILPLKENTERGGKMVEFYQGMLMAADSVRKEGTSVDIHAYHSGNSVAEINDILGKEEMKHMDAIFGPLDGVQANVLNQFSLQNKVRLVMPFATTNGYAGNNPYAYLVSTSSEKTNQSGANLACYQFADHNIVILNTGAADNRGASFVNALSTQLNARKISVRNLDSDTDNQGFKSVLSTSKKNLIVANSSSQAALQKTIRRLRAFVAENPEYKISLMGYPEWSTYQGKTLKDFAEFDTYVYTNFFRNANDINTQVFEMRFKNYFKQDLIKTSPRYGMMGMDVAYYFLHGMATLGDYFDERQQTLHYAPLQNTLVFSKTDATQPFSNTHISLIHYANSGAIEVIKWK